MQFQSIWLTFRLDSCEGDYLKQLVDAMKGAEMKLAAQPVTFADTYNIPFIPRSEVLDVAFNLAALDESTKTKKSILAILSAPGTGKSRLLDELPNMADYCESKLAKNYLAAVGKSRRVNVTFNDANSSATPLELSVGTEVSMALRVLHACFRSKRTERFDLSPIIQMVTPWVNRHDLRSKVTVNAVIDSLYPEENVTIFFDEFQAMGGYNEGYQERMIASVRVLSAFVKESSTGFFRRAVLAGTKTDSIKNAFRRSEKIRISPVILPPFSREQAERYVELFFEHNAPTLVWRSDRWIRTAISVLGTIPRLLERGLEEICVGNRAGEVTLSQRDVWDSLGKCIGQTSYVSDANTPSFRANHLACLVAHSPAG